MKMQIQLDQNSTVGSLINSEPFLLVDNEVLEIEFVGVESKILVAMIKNGNIKKQMLVHNHTFDVPAEFMREGNFEIIVSQYGDVLSKKWHCEPIKIIKPCEDIFESYSLISELESEILDLKSNMSDLRETIADLKQQVSQLWELHEI